jgi:hypothetical protein
VFDRSRFETFIQGIDKEVYRSKGFVRFPEGTCLFNFVSGRWALESFREEKTALIFIGEHLKSRGPEIVGELEKCLITI